MSRRDWEPPFEDGLGDEADGRLLATSPDAAPSPDLWARLRQSVRETHRFGDLEARCAELLDVDPSTAAALLLSIDRAASWQAGPAPEVSLLHVRGGPRVEGAVTGFVRIGHGGVFPDHEHVGDETVLILQGACEDDGAVYRPGDVARRGPGGPHSVRQVGPIELVYLAVVEGGVVIDGERMGPDDPRL